LDLKCEKLVVKNSKNWSSLCFSRRNLYRYIETLNDHLAAATFIANDALTLADVCVVCTLYPAMARALDAKVRVSVMRPLTALVSRRFDLIDVKTCWWCTQPKL
jgi:glutathione S-transferase